MSLAKQRDLGVRAHGQLRVNLVQDLQCVEISGRKTSWVNSAYI
jgi:hypothetical protein